MLTRIEINNINAISNCVIDFTKGKYGFLEDNLIGDYVNPIAIYGHNGSGKSSVLTALGQFIGLLVNPADNLEPFIVNQFSLNDYIYDIKNQKKKFDNVVGSIKLNFIIDDQKFEYYISTSLMRRIEYEYLKNDKMIFERKYDIEIYNGQTKKLDQYRSLLVPSIRYFASIEIDDINIQKVYKFLTSFTFIDLPKQYVGSFVISKLFYNISRFDLIVSKSKEVKEILKDYKEFPIYDVIKKENGVPQSAIYYVKYDGINGEIPTSLMSQGMINQSTMLSILVSLPDNSVLFIDEVESALHPSTVLSFINIVRKKKIQLVFSSHNTYLLQSLRPDQIYFSKWKAGFSTLLRLSNIYQNIREVNNIEKMYLSSVFDEAINNGK